MQNKQPTKESRPSSKEQRLNEVAFRLKSENDPGTDRESLRNEVFLLAFDLFDDTSEYFLNSFLEAFEKYDPEKSPFSHYLRFLLKRREVDDIRMQQRHAPDAEMYLDAEISDDNSLTLGEVLADPKGTDPGKISQLDGKLVDLTAQILNFADRHKGKAANETRRSWFRMFYTEDMTLVSKEYRPSLLHERDVFSAMELEYLDYYMMHPCRKMVELSSTPLKQYHQVVPSRESKDETPVPIPADVSLAFWAKCRGKKKGASARSEQYKEYEAELRLL